MLYLNLTRAVIWSIVPSFQGQKNCIHILKGGSRHGRRYAKGKYREKALLAIRSVFVLG